MLTQDCPSKAVLGHASSQMGILWSSHLLERHLRPHREGVERGPRVAGVGRADLLDDVAMQIVEHEASVAVDAPIQRCGLDGLSSTSNSVGFDDIVAT